MRTKEEIVLSNRVADISSMAIDMAKDRRVLVDFLCTVAAAPNRRGEYTHSREELHQKALNVLKELDL